MSFENKELPTEVKRLAEDMGKALGEVQRYARKSEEEVKSLGRMHEETKKASDEALLAFNSKTEELIKKATEVDNRLSDVEQKMVGGRGGGQQNNGVEMKTLGQHVVENEEVKNRLLGSSSTKTGSVRMEIETKTILSAAGTWGATASVTNSLVIPQRVEPVMLPMRQLTIRDLVAPGNTVSNAIEFAVQTARTNNAAVVAENTAKPYSNYTWDLRSFPVRTVAHLVKASRQILDDAPALQSTIDAEMRYGLQFAEEAQLLSGDGTGQNLLGIIPQASAYSAAFTVTGETAIDRIRMAMLQATIALYPVSGTVLNPTDWTKIEMLKDGMGRYIIGDPQGTTAPRLWGQPVVASLGMTAGTFLTGAFRYGAQIFDRLAIEVLISTENVDDFEKNMVSIRAEERLAFVVKRPGAFITGALP
jgi:HK97 family phage major capsid protein